MTRRAAARAAVPALMLAALLAVSAAPPATAGQTCAAHATTAAEMASALDVAGRLRATLDGLGTGHALVARIGSDISEHGLTYTHMGIAARDPADGSWRVVHQLNPCGTGTSVLRVHGLAVFMLDDLYRHDVGVAGLSPALSAALAAELAGDRPARLHQPRYSMVAFPGPPGRYQNSNQWVLEVLTDVAARLDGDPLPADRDAVQARYRAQGFRGSTVRISPLRQLGAGLGAANVHFDDHPAAARQAGRFEVVSVRSVLDHLARRGLIAARRTVEGTYQRAP
ncbi:MAG: DUF2145 domain-containing protein [Rhodobacterales bacterium]|nr:DUF2145 domain-containing protein [Rhodobacterales bacterium]